MRVCIVAQPSVSIVAGGPAIQLRETAKYLPEFGIEVSYFDQWQNLDRGAFDFAHIFGANLMNYDIAQRFHHFNIPFVVSSIFFTLRSPAFIRSVRKLELTGKKIISGLWTDYGFSARVCDWSNGVLPNTTKEAELVEKGFEIPSGKISVIPNGVDPGFYDADPDLFEKEYGLRNFILNVGHIGSKRKNVLSLIRAVKNIDRPVVIIGNIHQSVYAEQCLSEAAANPNIHIIESLPNNSPLLKSAYAACDVFALPSYFETPGIAALEAALGGAKIVITKYGGTEDYFGNNAEYVNPHSVASIAAGIESALSTPVNPELRNTILQKYSWRSVAEKTAEAYRNFVGG